MRLGGRRTVLQVRCFVINSHKQSGELIYNMCQIICRQLLSKQMSLFVSRFNT
jgi:hypothetical protein